MSLSSLSFLGIYFPILLIAYYNPFFRSNSFRKIILLAASLGLYALCAPQYLFVLLGLIVVNYLFVCLADKLNNNLFRGIVIIIDASVLLFFKYINMLLPFVDTQSEFDKIAFPIGLSYFTFKAISYVVDSKELKDGKFIDVAIYISNFLTIVSGPLSTYVDEFGAIENRIKKSENEIFNGVERIIVGLAKKVIIADSLSVLANQCFAASELSVVLAWAGAIAYSLQLFFDFSGYTDIAIGTGVLFGFKLPENFNYPYMAESVSDFWRKWHMSLTKWFTKYIYISLGGSRVKTVTRHIFNLFAVWFVTGIWHGSSLTFVLWAMIYFVLQLIEKYTGWAVVLKKLHIGHIYTMFVVVIEWVIFRSSDIVSSFRYIKSLFMLNGNSFVTSTDIATIANYCIPFIFGIVFSTNIGMKIRNNIINKSCTSFVYSVALLVLFIVCIVLSISQGYSSPLYAGF